LHSDTLEAALEPFVADGLVQDVLYQVKSGKEATVYCCRAGAKLRHQLVAAKVYKPRSERGFRNDAIYQEGRVILDKRAARAVAKRTAFGQRAHEGLWANHEWEALKLLHTAGADVPRPIARSATAVLMDYVGDDDGPAPPLKNVQLTTEEAEMLCARLLDNVQLWLACNIVHGDLSPFNVLYHLGDPVVIDFPQSVDPRFNGNAFTLLVRDIDNLARYFGRFGVHRDAFALAESYWAAWERP
jgi:RIO kinase 1